MALGGAGGRHLTGLGQRNAIAHTTPIGVFLDLAAHAVGKNRDTFWPAQEENKVS